MNIPGLIAVAAGLLAGSQLALAQSPSPTDFAYGMTLTPSPGKPLQQLDIPEPVYARVTRASLDDVRVFNAAGIPVPHAICAAAEPEAPGTRNEALPVFVLRAPQNNDAEDARKIEIETAQGTRVQIIEPLPDATPAASAQPIDRQIAAYVVDLRALDAPVNAIDIDWSTDTQTSEVHLRILHSEDLQTWRRISSHQTLVRAAGDSGVLERKRIALPRQRYAYLRLEPSDGKSPLRITAVSAELLNPVPAADRRRLDTELQSTEEDSERRLKSYIYDSAHQAPVQAAALELPQKNMALQVALASRAREDSPWRTHWRGEIDSISDGAGNSKASPVQFRSTTDRYWRLRVLQGSDSLTAAPRLSLAYTPQQLRFLAQGEAPYTLAFGSANVRAEARGCDQLLNRNDAGKLATLTGVAVAGDLRSLGNASLLEPTAKKTSVWTYVFWGTLIVATLLVLAMAFSLLKTIRPDN